MNPRPGFFRSMFILMNIGVIIAYLITCLIPFINTGKYWFLAFPGLIFPLVLAALIFFIFFWIIFRSKWWLISLVVLLLGYQQITVVFAFNSRKPFTEIKKPHSIRVMQWNASNWDQDNKGRKKDDNYKNEMFGLIKTKNPDVLCVEEYFDTYLKNEYEPNIKALVKMGFPHYYFVPTVTYQNDFKSGIAIFSKYPIRDSGNYAFTESRRSEHLVYADIKVENKTFRIFVTHLQSVQFVESDYRSLSRIKHAEKPSLSGSKTIISKLKRGYELRYQQAELIERKIKESPYPVIVCGDFNDVPNTSTYFKIRGELQDAFLKKGWGIGRTFQYISPTLRIDYILPDKVFKVNQFEIERVPYSDHYPLITDLEY